MSRRPWTQQQDQCIKKLVQKYGTRNWTLIAQKIQFQRSGKQCRQRWHNHLDPKIDRTSWSQQQQQTIFEAHEKWGNRWKDISKLFPGRTDNTIKNHFYSTLRRSLRRINKILGNKNSTNKMRKIKPLVLAQIMQHKQLPKIIFRFGKLKPTRHTKQIIQAEDIQSFDQMIQKLLLINQNYQELKQNRKGQQLKQIENIENTSIHKTRNNLRKLKKQCQSSKKQLKLAQLKKKNRIDRKLKTCELQKTEKKEQQNEAKNCIQKNNASNQKDLYQQEKANYLNQQMDIQFNDQQFKFPIIPQINIDEMSQGAGANNLSINGSYQDLCIIGTQMHLFETPRFGRTSNFGIVQFHSHGIQDTGDQQGESIINRQSHRKLLGFQKIENKAQENQQKQVYIEEVLQMNYSSQTDNKSPYQKKQKK